MKITRIDLYNFGSYEGLCSFDLSSENDDKRIIIIGGKNGAGKTTLFTAVQLCLYGNFAFGYKSAGHFYKKELYNLINAKARLKQEESTFLTVSFQHTNARELTDYVITREWTWETGEIEEVLHVTQNGIEMDEDDVNAFQNYLIHLIPPDMLKLYFFDGEKIADYFLSDNKINIREALMILSGNDTFDILHENVRRVLNINKESDTTEFAEQYLAEQEELKQDQEALVSLQEMREEEERSLQSEEETLKQMQSEYADKGGITFEQLNELQQALKTEEETRERINLQRKTIATDILPFLILRDMINQIQPQIEREEELAGASLLESKLSAESFRESISSSLNKLGIDSEGSTNYLLEQIKANLLPNNSKEINSIFELSSDDKLQVQIILNRVLDYDPETLKNLQNQLERSLLHSKQIRAKLQDSDAEHLGEYIRETTQLEGEIKLTQAKIEQLDSNICSAEEIVQEKSETLMNTRKTYENALKKASVSALSGRLLLMLEDLQNNIYYKLIRSVEKDLKSKLKQLIRKEDFFDDIIIDKDFNVHILRNQSLLVNDLIQIVKKGGQDSLRRSIGDIAVDQISNEAGEMSNKKFLELLNLYPTETIVLPVEINKDSMSSGEKQIFVMSLYWALMQQSDNELPFIIDTPFARIDTEHRANITEHFFLCLSGQLFILSTNEELRDVHLSTMQDQISHVYLLECNEDKKTKIYQDSYFEV